MPHPRFDLYSRLLQHRAKATTAPPPMPERAQAQGAENPRETAFHGAESRRTSTPLSSKGSGKSKSSPTSCLHCRLASRQRCPRRLRYHQVARVATGRSTSLPKHRRPHRIFNAADSQPSSFFRDDTAAWSGSRSRQKQRVRRLRRTINRTQSQPSSCFRDDSAAWNGSRSRQKHRVQRRPHSRINPADLQPSNCSRGDSAARSRLRPLHKHRVQRRPRSRISPADHQPSSCSPDDTAVRDRINDDCLLLLVGDARAMRTDYRIAAVNARCMNCA